MRGFIFINLVTGIILLTGLAASPAPAANVDLPPLCLDTAADTVEAYREETIHIQNDDVRLEGHLFMPAGAGPHPAVVLLHGGGLQRLNDAPLFFAPLLAQCGVAALVYDKRGTGASSGTWGKAFFDDFVADAAAAVAALAERTDIDALRIGLIGFSQGGQLAPLVSVRYGKVAFVVSVSGPFTSPEQTRLYALEQRLRRWGMAGAALDSTMALWKKHFEAIVSQDTARVARLDDEVRAAAQRFGTSLLPPTSDHLPETPLYNSMGRNYTDELAQLRVPMLAVFGERDAIVPVQPSAAFLQQTVKQGGDQDLEIQIVPFADHSFVDWTFNQRIKIEEVVIDWVLRCIADLPAARSKTSVLRER